MGAIDQILLSYGGAGITTLIRSIQQISITIGTGSTSNTATITAVTTANAVVVFGGFTSTTTTQTWNTDAPALVLTNTTTVTANRNTSSGSFTTTVNATVIEFASNIIQSMQPFQLTFGASSSATATISSVTTANTVLQYQGFISSDSSNDSPTVCSTMVLTNATTVTGNNNTTSNGVVVNGTAIEFKSGILNSSVQQVSIALSAAQTSNTATITSVNTASTMLFFNGNSASSATSIQVLPWLQLTNGTTVTASRGVATGTAAANCCVCEFKTAHINSVNRGSIVIGTGASSNTTTFTAVTTALTAANFLGDTFSTTGVAAGKYFTRLDLTNTTTGTATRNTSDTNTSTTGYEFVEFK